MILKENSQIQLSLEHLIRCSDTSIDILSDYFNNLDLIKFYCIKNLSGLYIDGDYFKK